jgi:acyl-CoA thioester hydrolase
MKEDRPRTTPSTPFPFVWTLSATLRDTDGVGHVNNAAYLSWIEEARVRYVFDRRSYRGIEDLDFILASARLDYRSPVKLLEDIEIWCGPSRVGQRSWEMRYECRARLDGRLVLEASSVQVQFDYARRQSVPLPGPWRALLEKEIVR